MHINHQQVVFRETHNFKIGLKSTYEADVFLVEKLGDTVTEKIQSRSLIAQPQFPFCLLSEDAIRPVIFCCISLFPTVVDSVSFKGKSK